MPGKGVLRGVGLVLPACGVARNVGEEKGGGAGW